MTRDELIERLKGHEWNDIEFKRARRGVSESAYETVSSFSNTSGGWIVFGVSETDGRWDITGVEDVDKVQNDFISALRADNKVNHDVAVEASLLQMENKDLLVFHVAEASRQNKPVYLNGDIRRSFFRRGGCDQRCTMPEIERLLRDASQGRWDGQPFDFPLDEAFDKESLAWYRAMFKERNPGLAEESSDEDFLYQWGYLVRDGGKLYPSRAAIMLFGSSVAMHHLIPQPTLDVQWIPACLDDPQPEMRWLDRVVYEDNILVTWRGLVRKYMQYEPRPFRGIDPHTLMRDDTPAGYRVFREASINLLIHQDYADHSRKAVIKFYRDLVQFWNPGDVFGSDEHLMEPGEKEVRNPKITAGMRRLALCEQAGTGMRMMSNQWQAIGNPAPTYENDRSRKAFDFRLPLATPPVAPPVTTQVENEENRLHGNVLRTQKDSPGATDAHVTVQVTPPVKSLLQLLEEDGELGAQAIRKGLGLKDRTYVRETYVDPALDAGLIEMTLPDKPKSRLQKYRLSQSGKQLLKSLEPHGKGRTTNEHE